MENKEIQRKIKRYKSSRFEKDQFFNRSNELSRPFMDFIDYLSRTAFLTGFILYFYLKGILKLNAVNLSIISFFSASIVFCTLLLNLKKPEKFHFKKSLTYWDYIRGKLKAYGLPESKIRRTSNTERARVIILMFLGLSVVINLPPADLMFGNIFLLLTFTVLFYLTIISAWFMSVKFLILMGDLSLKVQDIIILFFCFSMPGILLIIRELIYSF